MSELSRVVKVSELAKILQVVIIIARHPAKYSAEELAVTMGVSRATLFRYLGDARHMGADVVLVPARGYEVRNWSDCRRTVETWYDLEVRRDFRDDQPSLV